MAKLPAKNTLAFSLTTVPDAEGGRQLFGLEGLNDEDSARAMQQLQIQRSGHERLPPHLQKIETLAVAGVVDGDFRVHTLDQSQGEASLIADFFRRLADSHTQILTYRADEQLPILRCRALINRISGGQGDAFDLAECLGGQGNAPPLNELIQLQGLPALPKKAEATAIAQMRAVQIYLLYLRQLVLQGRIDVAALASAEHKVHQQLNAESEPYWQQFMHGWQI